MKKLWFGVFLLVFLLTASSVNAWSMNKNYRQMADLLKDAADLTLAGDLPRGAELAEEAQTVWKQYRDGVAAVADHEPLEEVDGLLAQLLVYAEAGETVEFAAACRYAVRQVEAVGEAQTFNWQNLL